MTTIELNNKNKTKITFSYDHNLPYKKSIRPNIEYGDWKENTKITLIKINFSDRDYKLFENPHEIEIVGIYEIKNEFWIDLRNAYLIIPIEKRLKKSIDKDKFLFAFLFENKLLTSAGYKQ